MPNSLPNGKILDQSKAFTDDKIIPTQKIEICVVMRRKHCGKRRKYWLPAFSPFATIFSKAFFSRGFKSQDCTEKC